MMFNRQHVDLRVSRAGNRGGFTLVEILVAITILLVAVTGPMAAIGRSLTQMVLVRDNVIAINLAQEAIEIVRQKRDSNFLAGGNWMAGLNPVGYVADVGSGPSLTSCGGACAPEPVYIDPNNGPNNGLYRQQIGVTTNLTKFSRMVRIENPGGGSTERKIIATVTWQTGGISRTVEVSEAVFNWIN